MAAPPVADYSVDSGLGSRAKRRPSSREFWSTELEPSGLANIWRPAWTLLAGSPSGLGQVTPGTWSPLSRLVTSKCGGCVPRSSASRAPTIPHRRPSSGRLTLYRSGRTVWIVPNRRAQARWRHPTRHIEEHRAGLGALPREKVARLKVLTAVFERDDDGYWLVELEEEPRVHSYGRTLAKAREHILDASALWFEVAPEELNLVEDIRLPAPVKASPGARPAGARARPGRPGGRRRDHTRCGPSSRKGRPPKRPRRGRRARLVSPTRPTTARQLNDDGCQRHHLGEPATSALLRCERVPAHGGEKHIFVFRQLKGYF
jgi:predicted RNase H-like HicB family nuclease